MKKYHNTINTRLHHFAICSNINSDGNFRICTIKRTMLEKKLKGKEKNKEIKKILHFNYLVFTPSISSKHGLRYTLLTFTIHGNMFATLAA